MVSALTWLGGVDTGGAHYLRGGGAKRDLDGALLGGWGLLCGGLMVLLRHWLILLGGWGMWRLMHDGRLNVLAVEGGKSCSVIGQVHNNNNNNNSGLRLAQQQQQLFDD